MQIQRGTEFGEQLYLMRVLHVDDDEFIGELVRMSLVELGGFEVLQCTDGQSAISAVETFRPQVLLLDFNMPGMTGAEVLSAIREKAEFQDTPALFLTAICSDKLTEELAGLKVSKVITKPVDFIKLPEMVKEACKTRS
ncbi:response regulator [Albibacillus kandeliae]|uniref:response regulator n=1 Tax=Albibacillus kandeliae TaxID=2174228 RepID=UPI000D687E36|nr:response regulator [Albibacillus kandeliae]